MIENSEKQKGGVGMSKRKKRLAAGAVLLLALAALWLFLQHVFPHRIQPFRPGYAQVDLSPVLAQEVLDREDYELLLAQTGLGPAAIDDLREQGEHGTAQILDTQAAFFTPPGQDRCSALGVTTREHRYLDEAGHMLYAVPLAPLKAGDVIVSFSTHTAGWTHGHAALVVDPDPQRPITLESVVLGTRSDTMDANHWRGYTTMMVLRPKAQEETRRQVAQLAMERLYDIPYSLVSGVFGDKLQPLDGPHNAQCGYLPWYAWMAMGVDLDGDGGRVVAPLDLAESPNVEVVQLYGLDPGRYPLDWEK